MEFRAHCTREQVYEYNHRIAMKGNAKNFKRDTIKKKKERSRPSRKKCALARGIRTDKTSKYATRRSMCGIT